MAKQVECSECGGEGTLTYDTWSADWERGGVGYETCWACEGEGVREADEEEDDEDR